MSLLHAYKILESYKLKATRIFCDTLGSIHFWKQPPTISQSRALGGSHADGGADWQIVLAALPTMFRVLFKCICEEHGPNLIQIAIAMQKLESYHCQIKRTVWWTPEQLNL